MLETTMRTSVVIATKDREHDLLKCLGSLAAQTTLPDEITIVESGKKSSTIERWISDHQDIRCTYLLSPVQALTYQNNLGIKNSTGDIVFFFDDDIILEPQFLAEIVNVFKTYGDTVGGVMGDITNSERDRKLSVPVRLLRKIFFLNDNSQDGHFTPAGFSTYVHGLPGCVRTRFLSGGLTAYKKTILDEVGGWDERLPTYGYCCDEDLSKRVSDRYMNYYTATARCAHYPSPASRDGYATSRAMLIRHRTYLFKKNFARTWFHWLFFYWAILGLFVLAIYGRDWPALKGYLIGITQVIRGKT